MKLITWNVNGIRAASSKGFYEYIADKNPDIICLQETKLSLNALRPEISGYSSFYNDAERNGYSGTAIFSKTEPLSVEYGEDIEGRVIAAEFSRFIVVTAYAPNAGRGMDRKTQWDSYFLDFLRELDARKPLMISGDLNVARSSLDVYSDSLEGTSGFTAEERSDMERLLSCGFTDVYRYLYRNGQDYSWWSYMGGAKKKDMGMRIDYWLLSDRIKNRVNSIYIDKSPDVSDHAPVILDIAY